jgi:hypothetical protein
MRLEARSVHDDRGSGSIAWLLSNASGIGAAEGLVEVQERRLTFRSIRGNATINLPLCDVSSVTLPRGQIGTVVRVETRTGEVYRLSFLGLRHGGVYALMELRALPGARREARRLRDALDVGNL